jgi:hypothetical protein
MDGGEMPTREEWLKEQEVKSGAVRERRPPSRDPQILQGKK